MGVRPVGVETDALSCRLTGLGPDPCGLVTPHLSTTPAEREREVAAGPGAVHLRELEEIPDRVRSHPSPVGFDFLLGFAREIVVPDPTPEPSAKPTQ